MVANMVVDQAAGLIVCSLEAARRHGVPEDRIVYLHSAANAENVPVMSPTGPTENVTSEPADDPLLNVVETW